MVHVHYRKGANAAFAALAGFLALVILLSAGGLSDPIAFLIALAVGAAAVKFGFDAASNQPALAWDRSGLKVRRSFGRTLVVPWRLVVSIGLEVQVSRYLLVRVAQYEHLVIERIGGRAIRLTDVLLQMPHGGMKELVAELAAVRARAAEGAPELDWRPDGARLAGEKGQEGDFDPDAALARYLAAKRGPAGAASAPAPPTPASPVRPVFGRRSSAG